jgi:photosystem II stability/assembly factor-like uncharacterized protein
MGKKIMAAGPDGEVWTVRYSENAKTDGTHLNQVAWFEAAGKFVAVGNHGAIFTSVDGNGWEKKIINRKATYNFVACVGDTLVIVGDKGRALNSNDGTHFNVMRRADRGNPDLYGVAGDNAGTFVAVGEYGIVLTGQRGMSWESIDVGTTERFCGVTYRQVR